MYIYHKQCGILQKNQWKGSNGQLQWFYKATLGALCWKRQKTQKLEKLKCKLLKLLKGYDLYRGVSCESWRPELSKNVVVFEIWRFKTKVIGCQSKVKFQFKKNMWNGRYEKKTRPQYRFLWPKNHHIFGIVRTLAFTWWYPGYVFLYQNLKLFEENQKKNRFLHFSVSLST